MTHKNDIFLSRICKIEISAEEIEFDIHETLKEGSHSRVFFIEGSVRAHSEEMSGVICHVAATDSKASF
jgi:hypothetical protein